MDKPPAGAPRRERNRRVTSRGTLVACGLVGGVVGASVSMIATAIIVFSMPDRTIGKAGQADPPAKPVDPGAAEPTVPVVPKTVALPATTGEGRPFGVEDEARIALDALAHRVRLTALADRAIALGERRAFDLLKDELYDTDESRHVDRAAVLAEMMRVQLFYASGSRMSGYTLPVADVVPEADAAAGEAGLTAGQLVRLLGNPDWKVRTRAAYLLGGHEGDAVRAALVGTALDDAHLEVVRECLYSLEENTGFKAKEPLDVDGLEEWLQRQGK